MQRRKGKTELKMESSVKGALRKVRRLSVHKNTEVKTQRVQNTNDCIYSTLKKINCKDVQDKFS